MRSPGLLSGIVVRLRKRSRTHQELRQGDTPAGTRNPSCDKQEGKALTRTSLLGADYVARLKAFGAFEQIKLHGFTLVQ